MHMRWMAFIFGPSPNGTEIITYERSWRNKATNFFQIDEEMLWFFVFFFCFVFGSSFWYSNVKLFTFDFIFSTCWVCVWNVLVIAYCLPTVSPFYNTVFFCCSLFNILNNADAHIPNVRNIVCLRKSANE